MKTRKTKECPSSSSARPSILIAPPKPVYPALRNLIDILKTITSSIYMCVSDGSKIYLTTPRGVFSAFKLPIPMKVPKNAPGQLILNDLFVLSSLLRLRGKIDVLLISQATYYPLISMAFAKLMKKKVVDFIGGSRLRLLRFRIPHASPAGKIFLAYAILNLKISLRISDRIVLASSGTLKDEPFNKFKCKISIANNFPSRDFYSRFKITKKFSERKMVVGYVGAIRATKGVYQLVDAMPQMFSKEPSLKVVLIGNVNSAVPSDLGRRLKKLPALYSNVEIMGYVPHSELPKYFNEMKLFILPSYTEGLPHATLEAMACGTPVAATPVGGIPEALEHGKLGWILQRISSDHLANTVISILRDSRLSQLSKIVSNYVRRSYTYESAVQMWRRVFMVIL